MKEENIEDIKLKDATLEQLFDEIESKDKVRVFYVDDYPDGTEPPDGYFELCDFIGDRAIIYVPDKGITVSTRNRLGIV